MNSSSWAKATTSGSRASAWRRDSPATTLARIAFSRPVIRRFDVGQQSQQGRLPGAVRADQPDGSASLDREGDVLERPEPLGAHAAKAPNHGLLDRVGAILFETPELLAGVRYADRGRHLELLYENARLGEEDTPEDHHERRSREPDREERPDAGPPAVEQRVPIGLDEV